MLKFSSKSDYALQVLTLLASNTNKDPVSLRQIAKKTNLPYKYLSQIVSRLAKKGLLRSKEGVKGGYVLARRPWQISLDKIIEAVEGPVGQVLCHHEDHCQSEFCACSEIWQPLAKDLEEKISKKTLKDIVDHA